MLRACVRTVSTVIDSSCAIWPLMAPSWRSSSTSASRGVRSSAPSIPKPAAEPPEAAERGRTCMPREARWSALITSRPSVSLERQAVAPNESIWLHSAAVGRLASTTIRVSGYALCSWYTRAGFGSVPKLTSTTSGECSSIACSIRVGGTSAATSSRCGSSAISTPSPRATRSSNFVDTTVGIDSESTPRGGRRGEVASPLGVPRRLLLRSLEDHSGGVATPPARCGTIPSTRLHTRADWGTPKREADRDAGRVSRRDLRRRELRGLALHVPRGHDVLAHPALLRLQAEREPDHLRQVQHRDPEVALDIAARRRLLQVEVEVAERARRDEAVGARVDRVGEVAARLAERCRAIHRDDREAAAFACARVLHRLGAEGLDHHAEVGVPLGPFVEPEAPRRAHDVAAVERRDPQTRQRAAHLIAERVEPDLLDEDPEQVLVPPAARGLV